MGKGQETRQRILDIAEAAVLSKGFGATSIEELIAEAEITKSGFFYHFKDKNELARALIVRYVETNDRMFDDIFGRAGELADGDPLQTFLIGLKLLAETMADLPAGHPGCLVATFTYQERLFDREVRDITANSIRRWNAFFLRMLEAVAEHYPLRERVDLEQVSRMLSCSVDGGIIMSRALGVPSILPQQIMMFRSYVKLLFQPAAVIAAAA
jgi:TetR/AcrR family transcriptional repressor of nem operon